MKRLIKNYILALVMLLLALFQAVSGFMLWLVIPRGGGGYMGGRGISEDGQAVFIWTRDTWITIHDWVSVALLVIVVLHLVLHWKWIAYSTRAVFRQKR